MQVLAVQALVTLLFLGVIRSSSSSSTPQCQRAEVQYLSSIAEVVQTQLPRFLETLRSRDDGLMQVLALLSQKEEALPSVLAKEFQSRLDRLEDNVQEIQRTLKSWQNPTNPTGANKNFKEPSRPTLEETSPTSLHTSSKDVSRQSPPTSAVDETTSTTTTTTTTTTTPRGPVYRSRQRTTELTTVAAPLRCRRPFLLVGDDCLYLHDQTLTWKDARRFCLDHAGDLHVPQDKYWYHLYGAWRRVSNPHPPLDFLEQERQARGLFSLEIWLGGADEDKNGRATWVTDSEGVARRGPAFGVKGWCIFIDVLSDGYYKSGATSCSTLLRPLCHQKN